MDRQRVNTSHTAKKPLSNATSDGINGVPAGKPVLANSKVNADAFAPVRASATRKAKNGRTRGVASETAKKPLPVPSEACTRDAGSNAKGNDDSSQSAGTPPRPKGTADGCGGDSKQWANVVAKADGSDAPETPKVRANDWVMRLDVDSS